MRPITTYRIILLLSILPLGIGFILFLCWYIPRSFYAIDYATLETAGFYAYLVFLAGLLLAILLLPVWCLQSKTFSLSKTCCVIVTLMLSFFLGQKLAYLGISQKANAFVCIKNMSGQPLKCRLQPYFSNQINPVRINTGQHKMFIYLPEYDAPEKERDLQFKETSLIVINKSKVIKLDLPEIGQGDCITLVIDKSLNLQRSR